MKQNTRPIKSDMGATSGFDNEHLKNGENVLRHPRIAGHPLGQAGRQPEAPYSQPAAHPSLPSPASSRSSWLSWSWWWESCCVKSFDESNHIAVDDEGEGSERLPNGDDDHHPITECSGVQWLDGLGGQVWRKLMVNILTAADENGKNIPFKEYHFTINTSYLTTFLW